MHWCLRRDMWCTVCPKKKLLWSFLKIDHKPFNKFKAIFHPDGYNPFARCSWQIQAPRCNWVGVCIMGEGTIGEGGGCVTPPVSKNRHNVALRCGESKLGEREMSQSTSGRCDWFHNRRADSALRSHWLVEKDNRGGGQWWWSGTSFTMLCFAVLWMLISSQIAKGQYKDYLLLGQLTTI